VGVFQALRPKGPLDDSSEKLGTALETLILQEMMAHNSYKRTGYEFFYWRTQRHTLEVDFVLYGEKGLIAIEVKLSHKVRPQDYKALLAFLKDYPQAKALLLYTGKQSYTLNDVYVVPVEKFLKNKSMFL